MFAAPTVWRLRSLNRLAVRGLISCGQLSEAFERAVAAPPPSSSCRDEAAKTCREVLSAYAAFGETHGAQGRAEWWARRALDEEESQLEALGRALPRSSGRLAPQLLDSFRLDTSMPTEALMRRLVAMLGAPEGLSEVLALRADLRASVIFAGLMPAGFALQRLDRRVQDLLSLWFSPGLVSIDAVEASSPAEVREVADTIAGVALSRAAGALSHRSVIQTAAHHRCFALSHPQMARDGAMCAPPLFVAHASLLDAPPCSVAEAVVSQCNTEERPPRIACLWSLAASTPAVQGGALRGLGLAHLLRREAVARLRAEVGEDVIALTPMPGFVAWIRDRRAWEMLLAEGVDPRLAEALRRAAEGALVHAEADEGKTEVRFVDADGDLVSFRHAISAPHRAEGCNIVEFAVGDGPARRISRLRVVDGGSTVRFLLEPGPEGMQVTASGDAIQRGELLRVAHMAEASGLLPNELEVPVLRLGREYLLGRRQSGGGWRIAEPHAHFHLAGGAAVRAIHWRADESPRGLAESLGLMASFIYNPSEEEPRAIAYAERGSIAEVL